MRGAPDSSSFLRAWLLLALLIQPASAQITLTYPVEPNAGVITPPPRADHVLIPFRFQVDDAGGTEADADVLFRHQGGGPLFADSLGVTLNTSIATPQVTTLFEGVTQIISRAVSNPNAQIDFGPATFTGGQPLFIVVDTGPPNNPFINVSAPNGIINVFDPQNARVTFTSASTLPFQVTVTGNVTNLPPDPNNPNTPPSDEVGASVLASLVPVNFSGSVAPLPAFQGTITRPVTVTFPTNVTDPFPPPAQSPPGAGGFTLPTYDFSNVADGVYELRLRAQDLSGNNSPGTTSSIIVVNVDRFSPVPGIVFPAAPLIVGGSIPTTFDLRGRIADERGAQTQGVVNVLDTTLTNLFNTNVNGAAGSGDFLTPLNFSPGGPIVPGGGPTQDVFRIDVTATDLVGNPSGSTANAYVILDNQAPVQPVITNPLDGSGTSALLTRVQGTLSNIRTGQETLEEHGRVSVRVDLQSLVDPSITSFVVVQATQSTAQHDSDLDDAAGFSIPPDVLGTIPDQFAFDAAINLITFPRGGVRVTVTAIDEAGNSSPVSAPVSFTIGDNGPAAAIDFTLSGPDDNYQLLPLVRNRFASDDNDAVNGVPGFFISLKSPERADDGDPPTFIPPVQGFAPNGTDPGTDPDTLILSVSAQDVATPIVSLTATGGSIPAATISPAPGLNVSGILTIDVTGLPEGLPELITVQATNQVGQTGVSTSVIVLRDVVSPAAPRVTSPVLNPPPIGSGGVPTFFTGASTVTFSGTAEPNSLIVVLLPATVGASVTALPLTSNLSVPNPSSSRKPANFPTSSTLFTRASAVGAWTLANVPLGTLGSSPTTPTPILFQAVDSFDNTDPARSVLSVGVIRSTATGAVAEVRLDPRGRNFQIFPAPAIFPAIEQFFREETIEVLVRYNTLITEAPVMTITQFATPARPATLIQPAQSTPFSTTTVAYRYDIRPGDGTADGPGSIRLAGGRDAFGLVPTTATFNQAFFVDTVAPVLAPGGFTSFFPVTGAAVNAITTVSVSAVDDPSSNGSAEASCISTTFSSVRLRGPIEGAVVTEIPLTFVPPAPDSQNVSVPCGPFTFLLQPTVAVTADGTYEIIAQIGDNVGNIRSFGSIFELDTLPIPEPLVVCTPADRSAVTTLPTFNTTQAVFITVLEEDLDLAQSNVRLVDPAGTVLGQAQTATGRNTLVVEVVPPLPGSPLADGEYSILADLFDRAGNPSQPVTCTFILDTVPPTITTAFPPNGGCIGPPLSEVTVELTDPPAPPPNPFPPAPSGFALDRSDIALRLLEPDRFNLGSPNSRVTGIKRLRSTTGPPDVLMLQFANLDMSVRRLKDDGTEDGLYQMEVRAVDRAGNTTTVVTRFEYDSQPPHVTLDNFPEGSFLADSVVIAAGEAFDLGPCGFAPAAQAGRFSTDSVQVSIVDVDETRQIQLPIVTPFFDFQNVSVVAENPTANVTDTIVTDPAVWVFSTAIPNAPGPARLRVRVRDRAGNVNIITREITIKSGPLDPPVLLSPPNELRTREKVITFDWASIIQAFTYDLELTRVTPTALTTTTTFPGIQFPRHGFGPLDLTTFVAGIPGGSPITTESTFRWRVRSNDVSLNPGPFSTPAIFVVDPTAPALGPVLVNTVNPTTAAFELTQGTNNVTITFAEDGGMDPAAGINVFLRVRDLTVPLIPFATVAYTPTTWSGRLSLPVVGISQDLSGPAEIIVRDARNRAGIPLPESRIAVFVDFGPFFGVRFFANPVIPEELQVVVKAFPHGGSTEPSELTTIPRVLAFQHGEAGPRVLPMQLIPTLVPFSAFRSFFRVDRRKIGFVDFTLTGTNIAGRTATRVVSAAVAPALALARARFFMKDGRTSVALAADPPEDPLTFWFTPDELIAPDMAAGASRAAAAKGLVVLERLAWMQVLENTTPPILSIESRRAAASAPGAPTAGTGLALYDPATGDLLWIGSASDEALTGTTDRMGLLLVVRDAAGPAISFEDPGGVLTEARPRLRATLDDPGSGIHGPSLRATIGETPVRIEAGEGGACELRPVTELASGEHELVIEAADRAGNWTTSRHALTIAAGLRLEEAVVVPSPIRGDFPARLRYRLTAPADVSVRMFDTTGRTVMKVTEQGLPGPNDLFFDPVNMRGQPLGNGVYFFRIKAVAPGSDPVEVNGKFAVLR